MSTYDDSIPMITPEHDKQNPSVNPPLVTPGPHSIHDDNLRNDLVSSPVTPDPYLHDNNPRNNLVNPPATPDLIISSNPHPINTGPLRKLMLEGYSDQELRRIAFDDPELRPVYDKFGKGMGKDEIVQHLLEYAYRHFKFPHLLQGLKTTNPDRYAEYEATIEPERLSNNETAFSIEIERPSEQISRTDIDNIKIEISGSLGVSSDKTKHIFTIPKIDIFISIPDQDVSGEELRDSFKQKGLELEEQRSTNNRLNFSLVSFEKMQTDYVDGLKRDISSMLNISIEDIKIEFRESTLITIALPNEKATELLMLNQTGRLANLKSMFQIAQLKIETNLDRCIEINASLLLLSEEAAPDLNQVITNGFKVSSEFLRFVRCTSREFIFSLILPQQIPNSSFNIDIKTLQVKGDKKEVIFSLTLPRSPDIKKRSEVVDWLYNKLQNEGIKDLDKKNIFCHNDIINFTFVLPNREACALFHKYRNRQFKPNIDFEMYNLKIGRYDWDNYLGLVLAKPNNT